MEKQKGKYAEYKAKYGKNNYIQYLCNMKKAEAEAIEIYRDTHNISKSELVRQALLYYIDNVDNLD